MMYYHKPVEKDKILLGGEYEYNETLPIVESFEDYIVSTCKELAKYDEETLASYGIECEKDAFKGTRAPFSYKLRDGGVLYMMSGHFCYSFSSYNAMQYGETPEMAVLRGLTGGMIMGCYRSMGFSSHISNHDTERSFMFEGNETRDNTPEQYIEGVILSINEKIKYDKSKGRYCTEYFSREMDDVPKSMTTYDSFDSARDEMGLKLEAFKMAWSEKLSLLKGKGQKALTQK